MHILWHKSEEGLPTVLQRETCTMSNKGLNRRDLLGQAMSEETWYNKRGKHKQQRDMQEFMLQAFALREERVEDTEETAGNK